jgi:hypothetical protein
LEGLESASAPDSGALLEMMEASPMETIINKLRLPALRAQIEASRLYCASLAAQFDAAQSGAEKTEVASRYEDALKQTHMMRLLLELLERHEREYLGDVDSVAL